MRIFRRWRQRQNVRVLHLEPGDMVVLRTEQSLSSDQAQRVMGKMREVLARQGHRDIEVIILDGGLDLDVLRDNDHPPTTGAIGVRPTHAAKPYPPRGGAMGTAPIGQVSRQPPRPTPTATRTAGMRVDGQQRGREGRGKSLCRDTTHRTRRQSDFYAYRFFVISCQNCGGWLDASLFGL